MSDAYYLPPDERDDHDEHCELLEGDFGCRCAIRWLYDEQDAREAHLEQAAEWRADAEDHR